MLRVSEALAAFQSLPLVDVAAVLGGRAALVLAPHPDDESLGCGGLIAASCAAGRPAAVVIVTDGAASHPGSRRFPPGRLRDIRETEARAATARLNLPPDRLHFLRLPDAAAPVEGAHFEAAVAALIDVAERQGCGMIVAPWRHDPHCDHEAVHLMAVAIARRTGWPLLSYPVWGWTLPPDAELEEATPAGFRLDIAAHLAAKRQAIAAHASQHGAVVDDAEGFRLPPEFLAIFDRPYEVFLAT